MVVVMVVAVMIPIVMVMPIVGMGPWLGDPHLSVI